MIWQNFLEGLQIMDKYEKVKFSHDIHAEHDQFWALSIEVNISDADLARLEKLGWFIDDDSWSCFT